MKASDKAVRTPHPIVEIVREEIPILEFRVEFAVDRCRVLVEILSKTCNSKGHAHSDSKTFCGKVLLKREFGATEARSGLKRAKVASDSCMTAFERRKLDKKAATLASPQLQSCSLS